MKTHRRTKAVFVDGASASRTRPALGIKEYLFPELYRFLTGLGEYPVYRKPIFTLPPELNHRNNRFVTTITEAGFEVVFVQSSNEDDDREIKRRLLALTHETKEVVIFAADKWYLRTLEILAERGVTGIHWVSTERPCPQIGQPRLSFDVRLKCLVPPFRFVELSNHVAEIGAK